MDNIFVDTSGFKAIIDKKDQFHLEAASIWRRIKESGTVLITSNFILDETFTLIRARSGIDQVILFRDILAKSSSALKIIRVTQSDEANAWAWFVKDWSKLSFTDCVSFALMKRLNITRVISFDNHFKRAGFICEKS